MNAIAGLVLAYLVTGAVYTAHKLGEHDVVALPIVSNYRHRRGSGWAVASLAIIWPVPAFINHEGFVWFPFAIYAGCGLYWGPLGVVGVVAVEWLFSGFMRFLRRRRTGKQRRRSRIAQGVAFVLAIDEVMGLAIFFSVVTAFMLPWRVMGPYAAFGAATGAAMWTGAAYIADRTAPSQ